MTGDGADELFAGHSYMHELAAEGLDAYICKLARTMHFSAPILGRELGVEVSQPYLDGEVVALALELTPAYKVVAERGRIWGKWILRKAFQTIYPGRSSGGRRHR